MTDVNISVELMADAFQNQFDVALLISADSDLVGPVEMVRRFFDSKRIIAVFPPGRSSFALKRAANAVTYLGRSTLLQSVFPNTVTKPDGTVLRRPAKWR